MRRPAGRRGLELVSVYTGRKFIYPDMLPDELDQVSGPPSWRRLSVPHDWSSAAVPAGPRAPDRRTTTVWAPLWTRCTTSPNAHGLVASYHPHLTTIVESPDELEQLLPRTQIAFCPDTAHLAAGGGDPAALIRQYRDRLRTYISKTCGWIPSSSCLSARARWTSPTFSPPCARRGYDSWLVVELDSYPGDPLEAAKISKTYLDQLSRIRRRTV